jgi:hypothetical protein
LRANALAAAYSRKEITSPEDAQRAFDAFVAIDTQLVPA